MIWEAVGPVASLLESVFKWVVNPEGYREWKIDMKLESLHDAAQRALAEKDFAACNALLLEYRRLSDTIL